MVPRKPLAFRQNSAQLAVARAMSFALVAVLDDVDHQAKGHQPDAAVFQDCYPSLTLRPGPPRVGSFLNVAAKTSAKFRRPDTFRCYAPVVALETSPITTLKRGSSPCTNHLFRLLSWWSLRLAMARSTPIAPLLVRSVARRLALRPITISHKVPSRVACLVPLLAVRACAADLLTKARPRGAACCNLKAIEASASVAFSFAAT